MGIAIVVVTYNRLEYTRKTIARLLEDPNEEFELYLWDNASTDGTREYLKDGVKDPRIVWTQNSYIHHFGQASYCTVMNKETVKKRRLVAKAYIDRLHRQN